MSGAGSRRISIRRRRDGMGAAWEGQRALVRVIPRVIPIFAITAITVYHGLGNTSNSAELLQVLHAQIVVIAVIATGIASAVAVIATVIATRATGIASAVAVRGRWEGRVWP